jgi:hypothetical protein
VSRAQRLETDAAFSFDRLSSGRIVEGVMRRDSTKGLIGSFIVFVIVLFVFRLNSPFYRLNLHSDRNSKRHISAAHPNIAF